MKKPLSGKALQRTPDNFRLSKWYADCIDESGLTVIAYYGVARWRGIAFHYSCLLELLGNAPPRARYSVAKNVAPTFDGSTLSWNSKALAFAGTWQTIDAGQTETIWSSGEGTVEWHCLQPRAKAEIRWCGNGVLTGLGYTERVEMTLPPWKLPIQELHWGRFLSDTDSLVWMDWKGPFAKRLLLHKGKKTDGEVTAGEISLGSAGRLSLDRGTVLRTGSLGSTALAAIAGAKKLLPYRILRVQETKWRSRAAFKQGTRDSRGWSIHEVVTWPG